MINVKGTIDHVFSEGEHLLPLGYKNLLFPVSKSICNQIRKEAGVKVIQTPYLNSLPPDIPVELKT